MDVHTKHRTDSPSSTDLQSNGHVYHTTSCPHWLCTRRCSCHEIQVPGECHLEKVNDKKEMSSMENISNNVMSYTLAFALVDVMLHFGETTHAACQQGFWSSAQVECDPLSIAFGNSRRWWRSTRLHQQGITCSRGAATLKRGIMNGETTSRERHSSSHQTWKLRQMHFKVTCTEGKWTLKTRLEPTRSTKVS